MRDGRKSPIPLITRFLYPRGIARFLAIASIGFPVLIAGGCWIDGTLIMGSGGIGLGQHYGYWAMFLTTPVIIYLTAHVFEIFTAAIKKTDEYCTGLNRATSKRLERLVQGHLQGLSLHRLTFWILAFIIFAAFALWLLNVVNTVAPVRTYSHDVFDAYRHPYGFYAAKLYLLVLCVVYSTAVFVGLHVTASMISIMKFLYREDILSVNFFHPDNCGGTSRFGNINLLVMTIYANFFAVIYAMYLTHRHTYLVMIVSLIACSVVAIAQSVIAVWFIRETVAKKKRESIEAVTAQLNAQFPSALHGEHFPEDRLAFRNHLIGIRTFPYAAAALIAVNVIRFAPAALAAVGYIKKFP